MGDCSVGATSPPMRHSKAIQESMFAVKILLGYGRVAVTHAGQRSERRPGDGKGASPRWEYFACDPLAEDGEDENLIRSPFKQVQTHPALVRCACSYTGPNLRRSMRVLSIRQCLISG
jgi:hypothetical protein